MSALHRCPVHGGLSAVDGLERQWREADVFGPAQRRFAAAGAALMWDFRRACGLAEGLPDAQAFQRRALEYGQSCCLAADVPLDSTQATAALLTFAIDLDPEGRFTVQVEHLADVARRAGRPLEDLARDALAWARAAGYRDVLHPYLLTDLLELDERGEWEARYLEAVEDPRRKHLEQLAESCDRVLQRGDSDTFFPGESWLFVRGDEVLKEDAHQQLVPAHPLYAQEGAILASVSHPNVLPLLGTERHGPIELLRLPLTQAPTLLQLPKPLSGRLGLELVAQCLGVLRDLEAQGILHLDVKEKNLLVRDGAVLLLDFGRARRDVPVGAEVPEAPSTADYVPPETALRGRASARSQVFQCGVLLYRILTGLHPFGPAALPPRSLPWDQGVVAFAVPNALLPVRLDHPALAAPGLRTALDALLQQDPTLRPDLQEAVELLRACL